MPELKPTLTCLDESGKLKDRTKSSFGGVIIPGPAVRSFTGAWEKRLKEDGLPHTSMKDAIHFNGPFESWRKLDNKHDKRNALLLDLANLINQHGLLRIRASVDSSEFEAKSMAVKDRCMQEPWFAMFEMCIFQALHEIQDISIQLIVDLADEYSAKCVDLFLKLRKNNPDIRNRTCGICFMDDEGSAGLQAADMVAYCGRSEVLSDSKSPKPIVKDILSIFTTADQQRFTAFFGPTGVE